MIKKYKQSKKNLYSNKYYSLLLFMIFLATYWFFGLEIAIFCLGILIVLVYKIKEEWVIRISAILLILISLAMMVKNYDIANVFAAYFYYSLIIILILKINKYRQKCKSVDKPIQIESEDKEVKLDVNIERKVVINSQVEKNKTALVLINIFIIITYIILFGAGLPNQENYFRFFVLVAIIISMNSVWPILRFLYKKDTTAQTDLLNKVKKREKILIIVLNVCLVLIYVIMAGFSWSIFSLPRMTLFLFILISVNFVTFADISND